MKSIFLTIAVCLMANILACTTLGISDRREGVVKEKSSFRIFVSCDILDLPENYNRKHLDEKIMTEAEKRFSEISQLYIDAVGSERASEVRTLFLSRNKKPEIVYRKFSTESVSAFVDYYIDAKLIEIIGSMEKKTEISSEEHD